MVRCRRCRQTRTRICSTWWSAATACSASSSIIPGENTNLLPRRRPQAVPGVAHLMVVHFRQIIRRVEAEILDVEPADRAEQGIGGDHAVALRADQPGLGQNQVLLRVQDVDGGALAAGRLPLN